MFFECFLQMLAMFNLFFVEIFRIFMTKQNTRKAISSILRRITKPLNFFKQNNRKGMFSLCEVKICGWFTDIGYKRTQFRSSYAWHGFILCTIYAYIIGLRSFLGINWITSALKLFMFFCSQLHFVQSIISIWVRKLKYFCLFETVFLINFIFGMFFGIPSVTIVSANWQAVFDSEIPCWLLLVAKLGTIFFQFVLV